MDTFLTAVDAIMRRDPGGRGLLSRIRRNPVAALAEELPKIRFLILLTGFPVRLPGGGMVCETDGPPGIIDLVSAFTTLDIPCLVLSDPEADAILRAGLAARGLSCGVSMLAGSDTAAGLAALLDTVKPSHVLTLERPGKAADGHFHNMRGALIDDMITDSSAFIPLAKERGIRVISVGDGGNESGMGVYRDLITESVPFGSTICADDEADIALVSGVSNWWGDGICAILSRLCGRDLLPSEDEFLDTLAAILAAGAVDGVTKEARMTVDGLPSETHLDIIRKLRELL